eukprot:gnl/MRDRNA2_/MRDRNA2_62718_c0_seq2.p1 gnl/MRDRNA2_/MRDRNA2_62718_c0~~gnl/MRDRNA2_/MRDRNA2_62718_c0_seq2.p1  ORF type:complete len:820 (+),score=252.98 gnl/MRDRNA2_/MRDRNA2_62718_c0_seq2:89-2548(+)
MAKSAVAKRGAGRGQSKAPAAPPAKKPRKATRDVENVDPKGDACMKKAKLSGPRSSEEAKKSREEVLKPVFVDMANVTPEQDAEKDKLQWVAPRLTESPSKNADAITQATPADPVLQKVLIVQNAFEDDKQNEFLELPAHVREMLRIAVPTALGNGSAADERHDMLIKMVDTIGDYLQQAMERCEDQAKKEEEVVQATQISKEQQACNLAALKATLEEKILLVKEKDRNLSNAEQAVSDAKATVPQQEVEELDAELQKTRSERDQYQKVITSSFDVLKACDWSSSAEQKKGEKKLFGPLNTLVKQLGADPSLVEAASNALAKNPSQRGDFDVMVVGQLEAVLRQPLTVLDEQIQQQETVKQQKAAQMQECTATVALMEQQLSSCHEELAVCKKEQKDLEHRIEELMSTAKDSDQKLEQARTAHDAKVSLLEEANKSLAAFRFLHERRITPLPEPAAEMPSTVTEEPSKESPVENACADALMSTAEMSSTVAEEPSQEIPAEIASADATTSPVEMLSTSIEETSKKIPAEIACATDPMPSADMLSTFTEEPSKEIPAEIPCATDPTPPAETSSTFIEEPSKETPAEITCATAAMPLAEMSSTFIEEPSNEVPEEIACATAPMPSAETTSAFMEEVPKEIPVESACVDAPMPPAEMLSTFTEEPSEEISAESTCDDAPMSAENAECREAAVESASDEAAEDISMLPAGEEVPVHEADVEDATEECAEEADLSLEKADPCWEFVEGLEPGSDPFSDKKSSSSDPSILKEECRNLDAVAVTTEGRIKFSLPPRNEWVPPRGDEDGFGTWVWKGHDEDKTTQEQ